MGAGFNADTEYVRRVSIPGSGDAGRLCDGGFKNTAETVWVYRPSATATYALTAGGSIIQLNSAAREVRIGYNSAGAALADLSLEVTFNSGGGAGSVQSFAGVTGESFLDEWLGLFIYDNATIGQKAGYIRYADRGSAITASITRANDNATSQFINTLTYANAGTSAGVLGWYAYARARFQSAITDADIIAWMNNPLTVAGDWGFWPMDTGADMADDSGNARNLTSNGTLSDEASPTLGGGGGGGGQPTGRRLGMVERSAQTMFGHEGVRLMRDFDRQVQRRRAA